jgi:hypothetical protein
MGQLVFQATLGGQVNLVGPNTASTFNLNVPAVAGNLITSGDSATVTNTMLAGSIANAKLLNSSVSVGSTSIALGASATTVTGLTLTSPTLTTPVLGTPASGTLTNCTGLPTSALTGTISEANGGTGTTTGYYGFKSRIINGAQVIDQRNSGSSVSVTSSNAFITDRFNFTVIAGATPAMSGQQVADAPANYKYSLKATTTVLSAGLTGTNRALIQQNIEGLNIIDLGWGTATASAVTLSFWVKSSLTGTFGGALQNSDSSRSYPFTYSIGSAGTWTQISVTIAGDTSGTWLTTNGIGIQVIFGLGVASGLSGTAGSWSGNDYRSATGAVSVISTLNATWQVTGVQLEKGSTATSFDYRPYGTELQLCQRYLPMYTNSGNSTLSAIGNGSAPNTTEVDISVPLLVTPRVPPTGLTITGAASNYRVSDYANSLTTSAVTFNSASTSMAYIAFTVTSATAFRPYVTYIVSSATEYKLYFTGCEL